MNIILRSFNLNSHRNFFIRLFFSGYISEAKIQKITPSQEWRGAVAEWSKVLLMREKINENQKIPGSPPDLGKLKKHQVKNLARICHITNEYLIAHSIIIIFPILMLWS